MKIIFFFNSYTKNISGGDIRFIELAKRLAKMGIDIEVVTSLNGKKICLDHNLTAKFHQTTNEINTNHILLLYLKRIIKALKLNFNIRNGDVFYSTSDFLPDVLPAFILKIKNNITWIQIIHHLYENPFKRKGKNFLINLLGFISQRLSFILINRKADLVIVVNPLVRKQLIKLGFKRKKIKINYNGIDLDKFRNFAASNKRYDCVFLGRLNVSKGIFDLIEVWKIIVKKIPTATLAIIGGGDEQLKQMLKNMVKKNKLENNIDILGYLEDKEAFGIMKSSKVFVFPSHEEGFGIAILEAMACGLPVVAWNLPVYDYIFTKGLIKVAENNIEEFANTVIKLLQKNELRSLLIKEAKKQAMKYEWNMIYEKEYEIIKTFN